MNFDLESTLATATIIEIAGICAVIAVVLRFIYSIAQGQVPGDGVIPAIMVGALFGAVLHLFVSGIMI